MNVESIGSELTSLHWALKEQAQKQSLKRRALIFKVSAYAAALLFAVGMTAASCGVALPFYAIVLSLDATALKVIIVAAAVSIFGAIYASHRYARKANGREIKYTFPLSHLLQSEYLNADFIGSSFRDHKGRIVINGKKIAQTGGIISPKFPLLPRNLLNLR